MQAILTCAAVFGLALGATGSGLQRGQRQNDPMPPGNFGVQSGQNQTQGAMPPGNFLAEFQTLEASYNKSVGQAMPLASISNREPSGEQARGALLQLWHRGNRVFLLIPAGAPRMAHIGRAMVLGGSIVDAQNRLGQKAFHQPVPQVLLFNLEPSREANIVTFRVEGGSKLLIHLGPMPDRLLDGSNQIAKNIRPPKVAEFGINGANPKGRTVVIDLQKR